MSTHSQWENIKEGEPLENDTCPVALMLGHGPLEYEDIHVDRLNIEYDDPDANRFSKSNAWTLLALIHTIDHPNVPVIAINTVTGEQDHLFGGDKSFLIPCTIEEYNNFFNLVLPGHEKAHYDDWYSKGIFSAHSVDEDGELDDITRFEIYYTPYKELTQ